MPEVVIHAADFAEGYQITSTSGGLRIKATDHHAEPLTLTRVELAKFGLRLADDHHIPLNPEGEPEGVLDGLLGSVLRAIALMQKQKGAKKWEWDVQNLRRAFIVLGGLDEKVVEKIVREEGM